MLFKITQQHGKTPATPCATFVALEDAQMFLQQKQKTAPAGMVYQLWEGATLLQSGSGGQEESRTFRPTPFKMALKPWSAPHGLAKSVPEEGEEET